MIVVDRGGRRRMPRRRRNGGFETVATHNTLEALAPTRAPQPGHDAGLEVVSVPGFGSFAVQAARIPHPDTLADVVAFLIEKSSSAYEMLVRTGEAEITYGASTAVAVGPVELIEIDQVDPNWFRSLVAVIFTAAGGTSRGLAMHEKTIGIPSTVVAFLRPERMSPERICIGAASAESSPRMQRQKRRALRRVSVRDGDAA